MANNCYFEMQVTGKKSDIEEFAKVLNAKYDAPVLHFGRVFSCEQTDIKETSVKDVYSVFFCGDCAWSVYTCMCDGEHTYNNDNQSKNGTTLKKQSKEKNLVIEVYSSEPGIGFQEHYLFAFGDTLIFDEEDYACYDFSNYDSLEGFNKDNGTSFTEDNTRFDDDGYLIAGGFGEWAFDNVDDMFVNN